MKNIVLGLILLAFLFQCKKNQQPTVDTPDEPVDTVHTPVDTVIHLIDLGKVSVFKNGILWDVPFQAWAQKNPDGRFMLRGQMSYSNSISESFLIQDIPLRVGKYPIQFFPMLTNLNNKIPESVFVMMHEQDEPIGDFLVDTTRIDHYIELIRVDSNTQIVEGTFQVFLGKKAMTLQWPGVPDSLYLTEGKFHLKVQKP